MTKRGALFPGQGAISVEAFRALEHRQIEQLRPILSYIGIEHIDDLLGKDAFWASQNLNSSILTIAASLLSFDNKSREKRVDYMCGYSVGQWTAMHCAGMLTLESLLELIKVRAELMDSVIAENPSRMLSVVGLPLNDLEALLRQLESRGLSAYLSNVNSFGNYTVATSFNQFEEVKSSLVASDGSRITEVPTSGGWHSPFLKDAQQPFETYLLSLSFNPAHTTVLNNVDARPLPSDHEALCRTLARHLTAPVQWESCVRHMIAGGVSKFTEFGYGKLLSRFGFFISREASFNAVYL